VHAARGSRGSNRARADVDRVPGRHRRLQLAAVPVEGVSRSAAEYLHLAAERAHNDARCVGGPGGPEREKPPPRLVVVPDAHLGLSALAAKTRRQSS